jgi:vacuolar-type H+-ATPase subunit D/Vma8
MNSNELLAALESLENKAKLLTHKYQELQAKYQAAIEQNRILQQEIELKEEQLVNFYNQDKITKIVSSIAEDSLRKTELKLKINEYIREIDKCIATLSN